MRPPKMQILFLCTGNSCRSQMAEGWTKQLKSDIILAHSAGTDPKGLNPLAVQVMSEVGIDISNHTSKSLDDLKSLVFDYVVTVCDAANETCPRGKIGNAKVVHVGFDDPPKLAAEETDPEKVLFHYRRVRDEIKEFVLNLPAALEN